MGYRIGFVYDLSTDYEKLGYSGETIAEFDSPETINAIEQALQSLGHTVERVGNIWRLVEKLAAGNSWDLVFNIAEGLYGIAREAQVPALLEAYQIPYVFSAPETMILCHNKASAKQVVTAAGLATARYTVVSSPEDIANVTLPYPLFAKPLAEGTGKGVFDHSLVENKEALQATCMELLNSFQQPVLVETYLSGREFTVGLVGTGQETEALGALEVVIKPGAERAGHTYNNKANCEELVEYYLRDDKTGQDVKQLAVAAWNALGCRDAGRIDIRCDANGVPHFLEVNPLSGLHPKRSDLIILTTQAGIPYEELIRRILEQAINRNKAVLTPNAPRLKVRIP